MQLHLHPMELVLAQPFRTAYAERFTQKTLIVGLEHAGLTGYGEATENQFYGSTVTNMSQELEALRRELTTITDPDPLTLHDRFAKKLSPFARCAIDEAWHDLYGKQQGRTLIDLWGATQKQVISSYTIGLDSLKVMQNKVRERPWDIYKIKMSGGEQDLSILRGLRTITDAVFRVDANCSWTIQEAIEKSYQLADLGVELIEQPLPVEAWKDMPRLRKASPLPLFADESCTTTQDIARIQEGFDGVNLKLTKCGGISTVRHMIELAQTAELTLMMGCMVESSVGISALGQLLPWVEYVDMDGALLLKEDPAQGIQVTQQGVIYPTQAGTGVQLKHL